MLEEKCIYFGKCGGCVWQDLSLEDYVAKKQMFIQHAFKDAGLSISLEPIILIPTGTRRRASFSFTQEHFGFNESKSHKIVDITTCPLLTPSINKSLSLLKKIVTSLHSTGDIFVLDTPLGLDIHIKDNKGLPKLEQLELLSTLNQEPSIARVIYNMSPIFEKASIQNSADSFAQPSLEGEETLIRLVLENKGNAHSAVDLFCGKGTFTIPLLKAGLSTMGYDSSESVRTLGNSGQQRDLFRNPLTTDELNNFDLIVLDPPRAGALAQISQIAQSQAQTIIMISCNPKTAARDSKILCCTGWQIKKAIPVDQFTYSNHVEIVLIFQK